MCGLETRQVEPDALPYEPEDMTIGFPDEYRDHRLKGRSNTQSLGKIRSTAEKTTQNNPTIDKCDITPPIDFLCRRLTYKWEPTFNFTHRYLHCRCVIRQSTPSRICDELTLLVFSLCPRHNIEGIYRSDYGNIDYSQDLYFSRFGGYDSFRAFIYVYHENIYQLLGCERFLHPEEVEEACNILLSQMNEDAVKKALEEYEWDVNIELERLGVELPAHMVEKIRNERLRRKEERPEAFGTTSLEDVRCPDLSGAPMIRELREILDGKCLGSVTGKLRTKEKAALTFGDCPKSHSWTYELLSVHMCFILELRA